MTLQADRSIDAEELSLIMILRVMRLLRFSRFVNAMGKSETVAAAEAESRRVLRRMGTLGKSLSAAAELRSSVAQRRISASNSVIEQQIRKVSTVVQKAVPPAIRRLSADRRGSMNGRPAGRSAAEKAAVPERATTPRSMAKEKADRRAEELAELAETDHMPGYESQRKEGPGREATRGGKTRTFESNTIASSCGGGKPKAKQKKKAKSPPRAAEPGAADEPPAAAAAAEDAEIARLKAELSTAKDEAAARAARRRARRRRARRRRRAPGDPAAAEQRVPRRRSDRPAPPRCGRGAARAHGHGDEHGATGARSRGVAAIVAEQSGHVAPRARPAAEERARRARMLGQVPPAGPIYKV